MPDQPHLTKRQSVALAIYLLGGAERAVEIEDVAVKASELAPGQFAWRKYPGQIDLEKVRLCAKNLLVGDCPWTAGSVRDGWMLTPVGVRWAKKAAAGLSQGRPNAMEESLLDSSAYEKFRARDGGSITVHDVRRLLKIDEYSTSRRRRERVQALTNAADSLGLNDFVGYLTARFPEECAT